tara:strand:+ start:355 stop:825 length:471 start_codon:yes stop_codon:yes gene_type:complete
MDKTNKQSAKTQKTSNVNANLQAQLDAVKDMSMGGSGGISATRPVTFGADFIADKDKYPKQIKLTAKYGAIAIQRSGGTSFTMNECNAIREEIMTDKDSPIYQLEDHLWTDKSGQEYSQDVIEIANHYGGRMVGKDNWKSKALNRGKSEAFTYVTA